MTFDFFNTSNLAFGSKITSAFNTLNDLADDAMENLDQVFEDQAYFDQFRNRNYQVPIPARLESPCRTDELYTLVNDAVVIKELSRDGDKLIVKINLFDKRSNRYTIASGETNLKEGYAYVPMSISNEDASKVINFSSEVEHLSGTLLFQYRIDYNGNINLIGDLSNLMLNVRGYEQYKSLSIGDKVKLPYTAEEPECICFVGKQNNMKLTYNDKDVVVGAGGDNVRHSIIYLKKGDKISGSASKVFKINYNT